MKDYSDFICGISGMMDDFGLNAVLITQLDMGEYDVLTGTKPVVTGEIPVRGILMDLKLHTNGLGTKDKTLIQVGDKVFYVKPTDYLLPILMPDGVLAIDSTDDRVVIGSTVYKVVTMKTLDPSVSRSAPILFELYLRR